MSLGVGITLILCGRKRYGRNWIATYNLFEENTRQHGSLIGKVGRRRMSWRQILKVHEPEGVQGQALQTKNQPGTSEVAVCKGKGKEKAKEVAPEGERCREDIRSC
jgi:hypothetical protein